MKRFLFLATLVAVGAAGHAAEIKLWHAFQGYIADVFTEIVDDFNHHSGGQYKVVAEYKGNYRDLVEKGLEEFERGDPPHILQVYEVATLSMMLTEGVFTPVNKIMHQFHKKFDPDVYIDSVRKYYSTFSGEMMSLPWNISTGILFYNKDLFEKAKITTPPKTWEDLESYSKAFAEEGVYGFTTAWPVAYNLEHLSCWHNFPYSTEENGFKGLGANFVFNSEGQEYHWEKLVEWQKSGVYSYSGRFAEEPEDKFTSGKCAILLQGANRLPLLERKAKFEIGVGFMPFWKKFVEKPYNLNIGGASFWVMNGFSEDEYRGIVQFLEYLSLTEVQTFWHQKTGYLPITEAAYHLTKKKGYYKKHPASEIAVLEVMKNPPTQYSIGMRFGNYMDIREMINEMLEKAVYGEVSPKKALDQAAEKGDMMLRDFQKRVSI